MLFLAFVVVVVYLVSFTLIPFGITAFWDTLNALVPWYMLGNIFLLVLAFAHLKSSRSKSQNSETIRIEQDVQICTVNELVTGRSDADAGLYIECAQLSAEVYKDGAEPPVGWGNITNEITGEDIPASNTGLLYQVWKKDDLIALAIRGTVGKVRVVLSNAHWINRFLPFDDQYKELRRILPPVLESIRESYPDHEIISTGHSLGGGLAQFANYQTDAIKRTFVFNSSPVTAWFSSNQEGEGSKILRLYETNEFLQYVRELTETVYLFNAAPNKNPFILVHAANLSSHNIFKSHSIDDMVAHLIAARDED